MNQLLEIFPFVKQTMLDLEKQNKFLNKVTLTGKINALHVAANLFEFTDKTAVIFDELKVELINALLDENIKKITNELGFKAKTTIDILIRNLFERTADVGFLSTDSVIRSFLYSDNISKDTMLKHLQEYAAKYSVYNEIVIFDVEGNVKINMNKENSISHSNDDIIKMALKSSDYIESYKQTDIFKAQNRTLMYAQKITHNSQNIGVLCLCFKFDDELKGIFENLSYNNEILALSDNKEILAGNTKLQTPKYKNEEYSLVQNRYIAVTKKSSGYQGYYGMKEWFATAMIDANAIKVPTITQEMQESSNSSNLLSENLHAIIEKANNIIEDIADVIINGELIASKQKVYLLTPILDNLRNISTDLLTSIKDSIMNLEYVVKEALIHDVKMASHLAIDIMDRNLYERANDSRWWALAPEFKDELTVKEPDLSKVTDTLKYINNLYTVYTEIFIYDKNKTIIASSNDTSLVGKSVHDEYIAKTLSNKNSQNYYVSSFVNEPFYNNEATYIYSASIVHENQILGGIGVVFDSTPEFLAMLDDSFPKNKKGFMLFIDNNKQVISSNSSRYNILDTIDIDDKFLYTDSISSVYDFVTFDEKEYIVASVLSKGYREYKVADNYKNYIYCLTFVEV